MPEAAIAPPAPAPTPAPAPSPSPAPAEAKIPAGIDAAMREFDATVTPKPKVKTDPAPVPDPKPTKPDNVEPAPQPDVWDKAPGKLKGEYFKMRRQFEDKLSGLEKELSNFKTKTPETKTVPDPKLVEEYQTRIKEMEQRLAATDYRQSNDFKTQFVDRWNSEYTSTVSQVKQLTLTLTDAEGNQTQRPATEQDFQYIMRLPPGQQDKVISDLFGNYAPRIFQHIFRLQEIERASNEAVEKHAKDHEITTKEQEAMTVKEKLEYDQSKEASTKELQTKWPQYFGPDEKDPEATQALNNGYKFVDDLLSKASTLPPSERAAYNEVLRARAAAFPRMALQFNRLMEEHTALKAELGKLRKSDPGAGDGGGNGAPTPAPEDEIPQGIDAAVKRLKLV